jgi:hypothetical protein
VRTLGEQACARLLDRITTPGLPPAVQLLPTELMLRSSCGCPPGQVVRRPAPTLAQPQPDAVAEVVAGGRGGRRARPQPAHVQTVSGRSRRAAKT